MRNSKSEILISKQIQSSNEPNLKQKESLENCDLKFRYCLGFSASNLGFSVTEI